MDFINEIKEDTIIICNNYIKQYIISLNKLLPIKVMSLNEFIKKYLYSYDEEAILFIMNLYQVKYEIAKEYIENTYYIENKDYGISKLDLLVDIKNKLISNDLIIIDDNFRAYAKRVKIIIYDTYLDNYTLNIFKDLDIKIINREYQDYNHLIYCFDTTEDEVAYVAQEIAKLIDSGISLNHIKLTNIDDSYGNTIRRIFGFFQLKVDLNDKRLLSSYPIVKEFINKYNESDNLEAVLDSLEKDNQIYNALVDTINKYLSYDNHDLIIYKLEHTYLDGNKYDNMIEIVDYLEYIPSDDDYIFMLGFNEGIIPKYYMDTNYITDNIAFLVGLNTTTDKNKYLKTRIINVIKDIKNLVITYKVKDNTKKYYESTLSNNFVNGEAITNNHTSYSTLYDQIRLVKYYDNYFKYGEKAPNFDLLNSNYMINYNSYNNKFTGIDYRIDKLYLSYSKMNMYNKCNFRYYLANILKLDIYEESFSAYIGSMVHFVMEKCLSNHDDDINKYVSEYLADRELTKKERFFLDKYVEGINGLLSQVLKEYDYSSFTNAKYEEKINIDYDDNTHFSGIIDKILYYTVDNKTYLELVDYKTGDEDISLDYLGSGINIQLPIYLYLASKLDFKDVIYTGFYLQKFNISKEDYRLEGYSNSDPQVLEIADKDYTDSKIIKGLKTNKDGSFSRYSKLLSNEDIKLIIARCEDVINKAIKAIRNSEFNINPKVIDDKNIGCMYCNFKDICFMTKDDEVIIDKNITGGGE